MLSLPGLEADHWAWAGGAAAARRRMAVARVVGWKAFGGMGTLRDWAVAAGARGGWENLLPASGCGQSGP